MSVYVINKRKEPLMPCTERKARLMLKQNKAKVVYIKPFTIQLLIATGERKQSITLGTDSGYNNIGFSAITKKEELIQGELKLLQQMKERLLKRSRCKRSRRSRLRYRKPRWNNRTKSKQNGWLAPSLQHKLNSHLKLIEFLYSILPITKCIIEVGKFDIQRMKDDTISGVDYQKGDMMGFWNVREYILHRDEHKCQNPNCKNKGKKKNILQVHHIKYKKLGGSDATSNLITLCSKCNTPANHDKGKFLWDWCQESKKVRGFKGATFMNTIRLRLINFLKERHTNIFSTYGYITRNNRKTNNIKKTHYNDAFCIAGGVNQVRNIKTLNVKQYKRNNRSLQTFHDAKYIDIRTGNKVNGCELHKVKIKKNKNLNPENFHQYRGEKISKGCLHIRTQHYFYQPNDLVKYDGKIYAVKGTQNRGDYVALIGHKKVVRPELLTLYMFRRGTIWD